MIHFGTGGWRAVIGDEFTRANVRLLTQGLANRILKEGTAEQGVVIGYDRRFLSDTAAWWAIEVLVGNDIRVTLIDRPSPTPTTMWTVRRLGAAYGMAVTASHNPAPDNGIKIFLPGGRDADQAVTDELTASLRGLTDADVTSLSWESIHTTVAEAATQLIPRMVERIAPCLATPPATVSYTTRSSL